MLIAFVYFLAVVLPHEQVGLLTVKIFGGLERDAYNRLMLFAGLVLLSVYLVPVLTSAAKSREKWKRTGFVVATVILSVLAFRLLIIINIEIVHFVQYGIMAMLLFPLVRRFGETLIWTTMLSALDEGYQYFYLSPLRTDYFDMNDVILNLLGAVFGLLLIQSLNLKFSLRPFRKWIISPAWTAFFFLVGIMGVLWILGLMDLYPPETGDPAPILLVRTPPDGFWTEIPPAIRYHVVQPVEGVIWITGLFLFYGRLDNC
jgi:VanZ family protein